MKKVPSWLGEVSECVAGARERASAPVAPDSRVGAAELTSVVQARGPHGAVSRQQERARPAESRVLHALARRAITASGERGRSGAAYRAFHVEKFKESRVRVPDADAGLSELAVLVASRTTQARPVRRECWTRR